MRSQLAVFGITILALCTASAQDQKHRFKELWGYMYKGHEKYFPDSVPLTDIGYFSAKTDVDGNLVGGPTEKPALTSAGFPVPRFHLTITATWNKDLMHLLLAPELPMRQRLIDNIIKRAEPFDGIQIDLESVSSRDTENFHSFLREVRAALPYDKAFSVAVLARWDSWMKRFPNDPFNYRVISGIADRIIVMAYDEHSGGTKHGPTASYPWCKKILQHATDNIPAHKLIMGVPFYGRSWQTPRTPVSVSHEKAMDLIQEHGSKFERSAFKGPSFSYDLKTTVNIWFEDVVSINTKLFLYAESPAQGVAFWRLGQEPKEIWKSVGLKK